VHVRDVSFCIACIAIDIIDVAALSLQRWKSVRFLVLSAYRDELSYYRTSPHDPPPMNTFRAARIDR
jgi:hypothetical protein